jgi:hypothetical protein
VSEIYFNQYLYHKIALKGNFQKQLFKGDVISKDTNLVATMSGLIDLRGAKPVYQMQGEITHSNLHNIHLLDSQLSLSTDFELDFKEEVKKVYESGVKAFWEEGEGMWGIDETYSCANLRKYQGRIDCFGKFGLLQERRIECERHKETAYDLDRLNQGWYSESHLCRPFNNHIEYITKMFNDIKIWK